MNHSNPITDILNECLDLRVDEGQAYIHDTDEAQQALYEAVTAQKPKKSKTQGLPSKHEAVYDRGYNAGVHDFLTNLSLLFGVTMGSSQDPKQPTARGHEADNLCGASVSWWDGEYEGTCELPKGHKGPHYDGISCFDDEGEEVELKSLPLPSVTASVGYYKSGQPYQVQTLYLNNNNHVVSMQPEAGVEIRVELHS